MSIAGRSSGFGLVRPARLPKKSFSAPLFSDIMSWALSVTAAQPRRNQNVGLEPNVLHLSSLLSLGGERDTKDVYASVFTTSAPTMAMDGKKRWQR
jgi:hypothetical protein